MASLREGAVRDDGRANQDEIAALYQARGRELWAFAHRLGLSSDECDDAVQEVHLRLWRTVRAGQSPDDSVAWLYRVLYRIAMDRHRWTRRVRELARRRADAPNDGSIESPGTDVWSAVNALPERQRAAIYLHYRADLDFGTVAAVMGITPGAARTAASRGLQTIRRRLGDRVEDDR